MKKISGLVIAILVLLFAGVLITGCTDSTPATTTSVQPSPTTPATTALYVAGDIVSPKSGAETGWLILNYDSGTDSYERAFIYKNSDGIWGYRVNSLTETLTRPILEKVNTVKVTHVDPSQVPLKQPTTTSSVTAVVTTGTGSTTTPTVTSTTSATPPKIKGIAPDNGYVGTSVSITDLLGDGFQNGATVKIVRSDSSNISATNVNVLSPAHITCTLPIPSDSTIGIWDIIVSNPDGQSVQQWFYRSCESWCDCQYNNIHNRGNQYNFHRSHLCFFWGLQTSNRIWFQFQGWYNLQTDQEWKC